MAPANRANKKVANSLVAVSSAAVLAVYAAGYVRTRSAADRFELQAAERRTAPGAPNAPAFVPVTPRSASAGKAPAPDASVPPASAPATSQNASAGKPAAPVARVAPLAPAASTSVATAPNAPLAPTAPDASTSAAPAPAAATADKPVASTSAAAAPLAASVDKPVASAEPAKSGYKDGTYLGWGHCRHGDIQASVIIVGGRIESAKISDCQTRYPCSMIAALPPQVAKRQTPDVDTISGATESGDAFYYAVLDALYQAK